MNSNNNNNQYYQKLQAQQAHQQQKQESKVPYQSARSSSNVSNNSSSQCNCSNVSCAIMMGKGGNHHLSVQHNNYPTISTTPYDEMNNHHHHHPPNNINRHQTNQLYPSGLISMINNGLTTPSIMHRQTSTPLPSSPPPPPPPPPPSSSSSSSSQPQQPIIYVYELPYNVRKSICDLLDADQRWRELGGRYMGFNDTQLTLISHALFRNSSPTNELLTKWESSNAKISHLYRYLASMSHQRAMYHLLPFVTERYRSIYDRQLEPFDSSSNITILDHNNPHHQHQQQQQQQSPHQQQQQQPFHHHYTNAHMLPPQYVPSNSMIIEGQHQSMMMMPNVTSHSMMMMRGMNVSNIPNITMTSETISTSSIGKFPKPSTTTSSNRTTMTATAPSSQPLNVNREAGSSLIESSPNYYDRPIVPQLDSSQLMIVRANHGDHDSAERTLTDMDRGLIGNDNDHLIDNGQSWQSERDLERADANRRLNQQRMESLLRIEDFEIPYKELATATDDFCKDRILGSGGFGTVYIGEWKGTKVAVKKLKGLDNTSQAFTELRVLNCCRIDNILPLYAVALDGPEPCLVYQYMSNGSLEDRLLCKRNTPPLSWLQRAKIGEGIARALNYLHTLKGNPFVHGDVKSANILLDSVFEPKLGDFGLARKVEKSDRNKGSLFTHCTVSSVNGTSVYLPSEYLRNKILSPAVDVYSYGIVILEMATGRRAYDGKRLLINSVEDEYSRAVTCRVESPRVLPDTIDSRSGAQSFSTTNAMIQQHLMDKRIQHLSDDRHWFNCLLELGRRCGHKIKSKRPVMIQVLEYFHQCKTTDRIQKLCSDRTKSTNIQMGSPSSSSSTTSSSIELQLWYDFVRRSCGPQLSDVVFENIGAQVTQMIEDFNQSSLYASSDYGLERLLRTEPNTTAAPLADNQVTNEKNLKNSNIETLSTTISPTNVSSTLKTTSSIAPSLSSSSNSSSSNGSIPSTLTSTKTSTSSSSSSSSSSSTTTISSTSSSGLIHNRPELPEILKLMSISSGDDSTCSIGIVSNSTIEDELSLPSSNEDLIIESNNSTISKCDDNHDRCQCNLNENNESNNNDQQQQQEQNSETIITTSSKNIILNDGTQPFIPLLTALGFQSSDIDQLINNN